MKSKSKGFSEHTVFKQRSLIEFMAAYARKIDRSKPFHYTDMNSASGKWFLEGFGEIYGSPFIAYNIFKGLELFNSLLIEGDNDRYTPLEAMFDKLADKRIQLECTDNARTARLISKRCSNDNGLIYYDPCTSPEYGLILDAAKAAPKQDVLVHVGVGLTKRNQSRVKRKVKAELTMSIREYFESLGKKYNYVTKCTDKQQWVLGYSSDRIDFIPPEEFINITTDIGKSLLYFLSDIKADDEEIDNTDELEKIRTLLDAPETWASFVS